MLKRFFNWYGELDSFDKSMVVLYYYIAVGWVVAITMNELVGPRLI